MWTYRIAMGVVLGGCARDPGELTPVEALTTFLTAVEQSTHAPEQQKVAFDWIDTESQSALKQRAELTASLAGRSISPWDMLVPGRVSFAGQGMAGVAMRARVDGDKAEVSIPVEGSSRVDVPMRRQAGRWRVVLGLRAKED